MDALLLVFMRLLFESLTNKAVSFLDFGISLFINLVTFKMNGDSPVVKEGERSLDLITMGF